MRDVFILTLPEEDRAADQAAASQNVTDSLDTAAGTEEADGLDAASGDTPASGGVSLDLPASEDSVPEAGGGDSETEITDPSNEQGASESPPAGELSAGESAAEPPAAEEAFGRLLDSSGYTDSVSESEISEDSPEPAEEDRSSELEADPSGLENLVLEGFQVTHELMIMQTGLLLVLFAMFVFRFVHHLISDMVTSKFQ